MSEKWLDELKAFREKLAVELEGRPLPPPAALIGQMRRERDEAILTAMPAAWGASDVSGNQAVHGSGEEI